MKRPHRYFLLLLLGIVLFAGGVTMRVYAKLDLAITEQHLLAARPASPAEIGSHGNKFVPADGPPTLIRLPDLGLWNTLQPVTQNVSWLDGQIDVAWDVADAGWHAPSGWPGYGANVVMAGHSPSRDPRVWARSVFRQLAYLSAGDHIEVTAGTQHYLYEVARVFTIPESEAATPGATTWIARGSAERLTLITCWPPNTAAYRVLVIANPVQSSSGVPS